MTFDLKVGYFHDDTVLVSVLTVSVPFKVACVNRESIIQLG